MVINSDKTTVKIKRLCIQTLLDRAEYVIGMKPNDKEKYRVVFKADSHCKDFFTRNDKFQKWPHLSGDRNIQTDWGLSVPYGLQISGFQEVISEEDGDYYKG